MAELNDKTAFVNDEESYNKNITPVPKPERKKDIDTNKTLYDNIIQAGLASQLDLNGLNPLNQNAENRNQMYNFFDTMCEDGSISAVVETYAEDATERNDNGSIVWVQSDDSEVAQFVEFLLDTLNVDKHIYKWVYSLCKYGDLYLRLYRESDYTDKLFEEPKQQVLNENIESSEDKQVLTEDIKIKDYSDNDKYVHYMEMVTNPAEMFELTKYGKTVGYVRAPVSSAIAKQGTGLFANSFNYRFKKSDIIVYPATEFVHAALEDNISRNEETISIFTTQQAFDTDEDEKDVYNYKVRKGQSLLDNVYKTWRELNLLETSVLLNRVTKSSIIRLINVEIGDMPKEDVAKTLLGIKNMVEQKTALNVGNGMSEYNNPGPIENNVYVPTHGGVGQISTSQIGGDVDVKGLADLDYYMNKLYGQLRVPKQYFAQTDDGAGFNGGTSLAIISSRYAKMVKRIQNTILQALTDAINLMLLDKKLDSYVNNFTLHMLAPTTQEEVERRDNLASKVQLTSDIMNMLSDIEDVTTRLKILKKLLSNVIDDSEIVQIIEEEIKKLEQEVENNEPDAVNDEEFDDTAMSDDIGGNMNFNDTLMGDEELADEEELTNEESVEDEEDILPNPDELGVDLTDTDAE